MVEVILSGFNIDKEGLANIRKLVKGLSNDETKNKFNEQKSVILNELDNLTPETISASYAKISRDPRRIPEIRKDARNDVKSARKSNKIIIFGLGHKSVAEHAVFNFDIMDISRLSVESVEEKRLQSYTEKSQRYVKIGEDLTIPNEIRNTPLEKEFINSTQTGFNFYNTYLDNLVSWHSKQNYEDAFRKALHIKPEDKKRKMTTIEGYGKEDARYVLSLGTRAQLGLTSSARNLEVLITKLRSSKILENQEIGIKLFNEVDGFAPSVIKYTEPTDYFAKTRIELKEYVSSLINSITIPNIEKTKNVKVFKNLLRDNSIIAGLVFSSSNLDYEQCLYLIDKLSDREKNEILNISSEYQELFDPVLREFELTDRLSQFIISSSGFAQLKRHRMNTIIPQKYNVSLGYTIPFSIKKTGLKHEFFKVIQQSEEVYKKLILNGVNSDIAEYVLTNAHRKRTLLDANNRQIHAFALERNNLAAQWDIRTLAEQYISEIQKESPLTLRMLAGKHEFYEVKNRFIN